jgi:multidrug efflux pump subunit AcrB
VDCFSNLVENVFLFPAGFIGFAFMPEIDKGEFTVVLEMNPQVTIHHHHAGRKNHQQPSGGAQYLH